MLIRFVVSNFLSFDEEKEFNMIAGSFKNHKHHVYSLPKLNVLKSAAIYGANGAGKSALFKAIELLKEMVEEGEIAKSVNDKKFKLNKKNSLLPVSFEIEFFSQGKTYAYGLVIDNTTVLEEWLYETGITKEDKLVFERKLDKDNKTSIKIARGYAKTQKDKLLIELMEENLLKKNELLVGKYEVLKVREFQMLTNWMSDRLFLIFPGNTFTGLVPALASLDGFKAFASELLQAFDTGVKNLGVENIDFEQLFEQNDLMIREEVLFEVNGGEEVPLYSRFFGPVTVLKEGDDIVVRRVVSMHDDNDGIPVQFNLTDESDGTRRMLDFMPAFSKILHEDVTILIDEIDQSLHPVLLKAFVEKVMSDEQTRGQLIFTTHEANLLDLEIFRQDEIWFVEKDKKLGSSHLYSLSEFKPRYDLDIKKGYLKGRFGAIPFLANLESLNWQDCDA